MWVQRYYVPAQLWQRKRGRDMIRSPFHKPLLSHTPAPHVAFWSQGGLLSDCGQCTLASGLIRISSGSQSFSSHEQGPGRHWWESLCLPSRGSVCEACWIKEQHLMPNGVADLHPAAGIQVLAFLYELRNSLFSVLSEGKVEFPLRTGLKCQLRLGQKTNGMGRIRRAHLTVIRCWTIN